MTGTLLPEHKKGATMNKKRLKYTADRIKKERERNREIIRFNELMREHWQTQYKVWEAKGEFKRELKNMEQRVKRETMKIINMTVITMMVLMALAKMIGG